MNLEEIYNRTFLIHAIPSSPPNIYEGHKENFF